MEYDFYWNFLLKVTELFFVPVSLCKRCFSLCVVSFVVHNEIQPSKRWTVNYYWHTVRQRTEINHEIPNYTQLLVLVVCTIIFSIFRNFSDSEVVTHGVDKQATSQVFAWITFIHSIGYVLKNLFTLAQARYQVVNSYFVKGCQKKCACSNPER